jgi:hypothetical protein
MTQLPAPLAPLAPRFAGAEDLAYVLALDANIEMARGEGETRH